MRPLLAVAACLAAWSVPSAIAVADADTGGFGYEPLPDKARPVNPGSIPNESGGESHVPRSERQRARRRKRRARLPVAPPVAPPVSQLASNLHRFPVLGPHDFGGKDARFDARRPGHHHRGQDITAPLGTPIVAPRGGTINWRAYQARGAGYYLVLDPVVEPYNYVFMHLQRDSLLVRVGDRVRTGQVIASVGSTGTSSGPHLHFEIWQGRWYDSGKPIDPLPALLAWDAFS